MTSVLRGMKNRIVQLVEKIDRFDAALRKEQTPLATLTKRVPMFESVAFVFPLASTGLPIASTLSPQEQFWTNGADDAYITEVSYSAYTINANNQTLPLVDAESGLYGHDTQGSGDVDTFGGGRIGVIFDFEWNYRRTVSGEMYGYNDRGGKYLSRKSLGNKMRNQMLRFTDPERVNAGDSLAWMLRPTVFNPGTGYAPAATALAPPSSLNAGTLVTNIVVNMIMIGYRDGSMAMADYDLTEADINPRQRMG